MTARKIFLPKIPKNIIEEIYNDIELAKDSVQKNNVYTWISASCMVQEWCQKNICPDIHWGIQVISGNLDVHKDIGTQIKFNYIINSAGSDVVTKFYDDNMNIIDTIKFEVEEWYILDVSKYHGVTGVDRDQVRISITGRIFSNINNEI